jgi:hypothetical protein
MLKENHNNKKINVCQLQNVISNSKIQDLPSTLDIYSVGQDVHFLWGQGATALNSFNSFTSKLCLIFPLRITVQQHRLSQIYRKPVIQLWGSFVYFLCVWYIHQTVGKLLYDTFPFIICHLKGIRKWGIKLRGTLHHMVCADVNFLGEDLSIIKKNWNVLLVASDKFGLGVNAEKSKNHIY